MRITIACVAVLLLSTKTDAQQQESLKESLRFLASFDRSVDADVARGNKQLMTAKSLRREEVSPGLIGDAVQWDKTGGRYGGCLSFKKKTDAIVFYHGANNMPSTDSEFAGTISFWLRLTPDEDLPPGYVDPLQITDKKWNDASIFVDFTEKNPRQFRLGVFSDFAYWNPDDRKWEKIPDDERPLVTLKEPTFSKDSWTHVAIAFEGFNRDEKPGRATLYVDGVSVGDLNRSQHFTWAPERLAIMLGIYYIGDLDEFAVFDRCLSAKQVAELAKSTSSLTDWLR